MNIICLPFLFLCLILYNFLISKSSLPDISVLSLPSVSFSSGIYTNMLSIVLSPLFGCSLVHFYIFEFGITLIVFSSNIIVVILFYFFFINRLDILLNCLPCFKIFCQFVTYYCTLLLLWLSDSLMLTISKNASGCWTFSFIFSFSVLFKTYIST